MTLFSFCNCMPIAFNRCVFPKPTPPQSIKGYILINAHKPSLNKIKQYHCFCTQNCQNLDEVQSIIV